MNVSLTVAVPGEMEGKRIPITLEQFVIGRDPQCHLCPGSPRVAMRHCALLVRGNKVFLKNFDQREATYVNDRRIEGEVQLLHGDWLKIGPLLFGVNIEEPASPHEDVAAQLLLREEEGVQQAAGGNPPGQGPETVPAPDAAPPRPLSPAVRAILDKYRRRRR